MTRQAPEALAIGYLRNHGWRKSIDEIARRRWTGKRPSGAITTRTPSKGSKKK